MSYKDSECMRYCNRVSEREIHIYIYKECRERVGEVARLQKNEAIVFTVVFKAASLYVFTNISIIYIYLYVCRVLHCPHSYIICLCV